MRSLARLKYLFYDYYWKVAYRYSDIGVQSVKGDINDLKIIDTPKGIWIADPFLAGDEQGLYLFVEYTDTKKKKSVLACKKMIPEEKDFHIIYESDGHISYPCVFEWEGDRYIIPETLDRKEIILLKCEKWPYKWGQDSILMKDICAVDCTPVIIEGQLHIFIYEGNTLKLGKLDFESKTITNVVKLLEYESNLGRPGGHSIYFEDSVIRVIQPGRNYYGEKLQFAKAVFFNEEYKETIVNEILPEQIKINTSEKIIGVHTYNKCNEYEIYDIMIRKFNVIKPIQIILHKLGLFGYGEYEKKRKILFNEDSVI